MATTSSSDIPTGELLQRVAKKLELWLEQQKLRTDKDDDDDENEQKEANEASERHNFPSVSGENLGGREDGVGRTDQQNHHLHHHNSTSGDDRNSNLRTEGGTDHGISGDQQQQQQQQQQFHHASSSSADSNNPNPVNNNNGDGDHDTNGINNNNFNSINSAGTPKRQVNATTNSGNGAGGTTMYSTTAHHHSMAGGIKDGERGPKVLARVSVGMKNGDWTSGQLVGTTLELEMGETIALRVLKRLEMRNVGDKKTVHCEIPTIDGAFMQIAVQPLGATSAEECLRWLEMVRSQAQGWFLERKSKGLLRTQWKPMWIQVSAQGVRLYKPRSALVWWSAPASSVDAAVGPWGRGGGVASQVGGRGWSLIARQSRQQ